MRRVGVEEAAAVGAQLLDRLLRGDRSAGQHLRTADEGLHLGEAVEVLDDAGGEQCDRSDDRQRKQQPESAANQVDPEVAEGVGAASGEPADERDGYGDAHSRRDEVLDGESGKLHRVPQRELGRVRLPVGVRDERDRGVERETFGHRGQSEGVGEDGLQTLQQVDEQDADHREDQYAAQVGAPGLSGCRIHADQPVHTAFDPQVLSALVHVRDVVTQRPIQEAQDQNEGRELEDAEPDRLRTDSAHQKRSGFTSAKTR